ncbi:hypothetical protein ANN_28021 [Periplaneta americana]|uniref:Uncharacterized protein n=1 Tax=Periplaneta americana TaxID=6978 RepID=A0ABQ8RUS7_PERAM|nr:hypothetical protein ANN_28021 [Periplaneta americana]
MEGLCEGDNDALCSLKAILNAEEYQDDILTPFFHQLTKEEKSRFNEIHPLLIQQKIPFLQSRKCLQIECSVLVYFTLVLQI